MVIITRAATFGYLKVSGTQDRPQSPYHHLYLISHIYLLEQNQTNGEIQGTIIVLRRTIISAGPSLSLPRPPIARPSHFGPLVLYGNSSNREKCSINNVPQLLPPRHAFPCRANCVCCFFFSPPFFSDTTIDFFTIFACSFV